MCSIAVWPLGSEPITDTGEGRAASRQARPLSDKWVGIDQGQQRTLQRRHRRASSGREITTGGLEIDQRRTGDRSETDLVQARGTPETDQDRSETAQRRTGDRLKTDRRQIRDKSSDGSETEQTQTEDESGAGQKYA